MRLAPALVLTVAVAASAAAASSIVAQVGQRSISEEMIRAEIGRLRATGDLAGALKTMTPDGRREIVDGLVRDELMGQAARASGLATRPDVRDAIDRATTAILADAFRRETLASADVSDAALRRYFDGHAAEFQGAPRVRARHILLKARSDADAVVADLRRGAAFDALARERSADPTTRAAGGEIGWVSRGVMVKPFEDALFSLKAGEISGVVESSLGFHVIQAEEIQAAAARSFESQREAVRARVRDARLEETLGRLRTEYPVTMFPDALKALER